MRKLTLWMQPMLRSMFVPSRLVRGGIEWKSQLYRCLAPSSPYSYSMLVVAITHWGSATTTLAPNVFALVHGTLPVCPW